MEGLFDLAFSRKAITMNKILTNICSDVWKDESVHCKKIYWFFSNFLPKEHGIFDERQLFFYRVSWSIHKWSNKKKWQGLLKCRAFGLVLIPGAPRVVVVKSDCHIRQPYPLHLPSNLGAPPPNPLTQAYPNMTKTRGLINDDRCKFRNTNWAVWTLASHLSMNDSDSWNCKCFAWGHAYAKDGFYHY